MKKYNSVKLEKELKRDFVIEKLLDKGIIRSQQGIDIYDLTYEELKYELVLVAFREIDINSDSHKWF